MSTSVLSGASSVNGDDVTLPAIQNLIANHLYRIELIFIDSTGNKFEPFFNIAAQD